MSAPAIFGTQQSSDQAVLQQAARPKPRQEQKHSVQHPTTSVPVILAVASAVGVLLWWKGRKKPSGKGSSGDPSSSRSRFAFPRRKGRAKANPSTNLPADALPRNKQARNNKKKNVKHKAEMQRRAEKRDKAASDQVEQEKRADPDDPNNHLVFNYSYYDTARRDHLHAPAQAPKKLEK